MFELIKEDYTAYYRPWFNSGFHAMVFYRFGRWTLGLKFKPARFVLGKFYALMRPFVELTTWVQMDRQTTVGRRLHLIHAGPVHIHIHCIIGDRVGMMHGVTLGQNMGPGVPTIGNDVFIGCNASILGGVKIGDGARIGANSLVISDVPAGATAMGVPARIIPNTASLREKSAATATTTAKTADTISNTQGESPATIAATSVAMPATAQEAPASAGSKV